MKFKVLFSIIVSLQSYTCISMQKRIDLTPVEKINSFADQETQELMLRIGEPWKTYEPEKRLEFSPEVYTQLQEQFEPECLNQRIDLLEKQRQRLKEQEYQYNQTNQKIDLLTEKRINQEIVLLKKEREELKQNIAQR